MLYFLICLIVPVFGRDISGTLDLTVVLEPEEKTLPPNHNAPAGKILVATGNQNGYTDTVQIFDPELKTHCKMPNFPIKTEFASGSVVDSLGDQLPVICGGGENNDKGNCYIYDKENQQWVAGVYSYGQETYFIAMVSFGKWLFLAGGSQTGNYIDDTIIVDALGNKRNGPKLEQAKHGACAAVIKEEGGQKTIAVLGGSNGFDPWTIQYRRDMEIFSCSIGENPACIKKPNGPKLQAKHNGFGCGVIQGQNGGQILLAMKSWQGNGKTETLDLDDDSAQWKILKKDVDEELGSTSLFSLIISQDPTKGYWLPPERDYLYEVTCRNAQDCSFNRRRGYGFLSKNKRFVAMSLPNNHGLQCD